MFLVPGANGIVDLEEALPSWWRRLLERVGGIADSDNKTHGGSNSEEQALTWLFDARRIGLGKLMQPWCSSLGSVNTGPSFPSAIRFDEVAPLNAQDIGWLTINQIRARHGITKGACSNMSIKLSIECGIPLGPVRETL